MRSAADELKVVWSLRRVLHALESQQALELLLSKLKDTASNTEFLLQVQKTTPGGSSNRDNPTTVTATSARSSFAERSSIAAMVRGAFTRAPASRRSTPGGPHATAC